MLKSIFDGKTGRKNEPEYVIASFSLHSYPRFKSGYSSDYIGWSKPTISVRQLESLQIGQPVRFGGENVRVADRSGDSITLQFESIYDKEKQETRTVSLNEPVETGYVADLYDASHSFYFGCCGRVCFFYSLCYTFIIRKSFQEIFNKLSIFTAT